MRQKIIAESSYESFDEIVQLLLYGLRYDANEHRVVMIHDLMSSIPQSGFRRVEIVNLD